MELRDDQGTTQHLRPTAMEKVVLSVIAAVTIALLSWVGYTLMGTAQQVAVINTKLDFLQENAKSSYSAADAAADQRNIEQRFTDFDRRITTLEKLHGR